MAQSLPTIKIKVLPRKEGFALDNRRMSPEPYIIKTLYIK